MSTTEVDAMQAGKILVCALCALLAAACTPTVKVEAPDKPIEINLNVKIQQEVRVKIDKDLDAAIANDPALFGTKKGKK
jgi:hypothetical protein